MAELENYNPTSRQRIESKEKVSNIVKEPFNITSSIIKAFEDDIFLLSGEVLHRNQAKEEGRKEGKKEETIPDWVKVSKFAFKE